jgi:hypothetical protein
MTEITRRTMLAATALAGTAVTAVARPAEKRAYRRIATEEGFLSHGVLAQNAKTQIAGVPLISSNGPTAGGLTELGAERLHPGKYLGHDQRHELLDAAENDARRSRQRAGYVRDRLSVRDAGRRGQIG